MKKIYITIAILLLIQVGAARVFAASTSPTPTPNQAVTTQIEQQINNLKDKIASKVAQLKLVDKQGIMGIVTDSTATQITLKDTSGNIHFVDVDELTKFNSASNNTYGISDVTKGTTLGILGLYNKDSRRLLARFVTVLILPTYIHGAIAAIDKTNFTLTIAQNDGTQTVAEIEDVTKTTSYDSTAGIVKSGFSKLVVGERVYVVGYPDKQNTKELIASRIITFPTLLINPAIGNVLPVLTPTAATPSAIPTGK